MVNRERLTLYTVECFIVFRLLRRRLAHHHRRRGHLSRSLARIRHDQAKDERQPHTSKCK